MDTCIICGGTGELYPYREDWNLSDFYYICAVCLFGTRPATAKKGGESEEEENLQG